MKKYKLKEEAKRFLTDKLNVQIGEVIQTLEDWEKVNFCIEALEEVPQRIKLYGQLEDGYCRYLRKKDATHFTDKQRIICEKAINGELFTKDDMDEYLCFCDGKIKTVDEWLQHKQDEYVMGQAENYQER